MPYENKTGSPSVTQILKPHLDTQWFTADCRARGSAVHTACYAELMGVYAVPLPADWQLYVESFKRWLDAVKPTVIMAEKRLVDNEAGYCGQLDFYGEIHGRTGRGVIDIKTAQQKHKWHRLQGAAYRGLVGPHGGSKWGGNLRLSKDGRMPIFDPWPDDYMADLFTFNNCLTAWRFFNE